MAINTDNKKTTLGEDANIYTAHKTISEKELWNKMDKEEKKVQFREYYMVPILVGIVVSFVVGYLIFDAVSSYRDISFMATIINDDVDDDKLKALNEGFLEYIGGNPQKEKSNICEGYIISGGSGADAVNAAESITSYIYAKQLDAMIADESTFNHYASLGCFLDLSELLSPEEYAKYKDYIYYPQLEENTDNIPGDKEHGSIRPKETYPCGIYLSSSKTYGELEAVQPKPVIGIVATSARRENAVAFLEFLFQKDNQDN